MTNKFQLRFDNKHMRKIDFNRMEVNAMCCAMLCAYEINIKVLFICMCVCLFPLSFTLHSVFHPIFHAAAKHSMSMHRIFADDTHLFSSK